jgi:hypothetical protein
MVGNLGSVIEKPGQPHTKISVSSGSVFFFEEKEKRVAGLHSHYFSR